MVCIYCGAKTEVTNSRRQSRSNAIWRRRHCLKCGAIFTTAEQPDLAASLRVADDSGKLHAFSRDRLFLSVYESCKHRPTALTDAASLTQLIITRLLHNQSQAGLLPLTLIKQTTYHALQQFDGAAATFYQAYHPSTERSKLS